MNNDLISRSELKKVLIEEYEAREHYIGEIMLKAIDNAPTVEGILMTEKELEERDADAFETGYIRGLNHENEKTT